MNVPEAVDAAMEMQAGGRTAYICYDGALRVGDSPSGRVVLSLPPGRPRARKTLVALLPHRMRMTGIR